MSLIIAASKGNVAIIGGDRRSIAFFGDCEALEEELYSGRLATDEELIVRAKELGASLQVTDGREKVWRQGDVLVGEVTEISRTLERRRRIYLVPGAYLMADITGKEALVIGQGKVACMVLGNRFTQMLASQEIQNAGGRVDEAIVKSILTNVGMRTPSISKENLVLSTSIYQRDPDAAIKAALQDDCQRLGWKLCDQP
jgi:hypothetical protein